MPPKGDGKGGTVIALDDYEAVMKAAGDPVRARILKLLAERELCVRQLVEVLGYSQSSVSGHLSILSKAGLVTARKQGRWAYYALPDIKRNPYAPPMLALLMGWLDDDRQVRTDKRRLSASEARDASR
ncbi:MAG: ArsR/SmtB family transcription factor [Thermoleophilia bacterium]